MVLLDGKKTASSIFESIGESVKELKDNGKQIPHLTAIIVGEDPASKTYVNAKMKACERVGFTSNIDFLPSDTSEIELVRKIKKLNADPKVTGFIVQLPLPDHINDQQVILAIDPKKDVDGFHPENIGKMTIGLPGLKPATPTGILELMNYYDIATAGKNCVVLGRSNIVGMPISVMLASKAKPGNCTITICHSRTENLEEFTQKADILVVAIGKKEFITPDMVREGAVVIDVGIHREPADNKKGYVLKGDVDFTGLENKVSHMTPVPGGVGPLTIASLLKNTLKAYYLNPDID